MWDFSKDFRIISNLLFALTMSSTLFLSDCSSSSVPPYLWWWRAQRSISIRSASEESIFVIFKKNKTFFFRLIQSCLEFFGISKGDMEYLSSHGKWPAESSRQCIVDHVLLFEAEPHPDFLSRDPRFLEEFIYNITHFIFQDTFLSFHNNLLLCPSMRRDGFIFFLLSRNYYNHLLPKCQGFVN